MFVPLVGLTSLLSQLNGTQSPNLNAGTAASSTTLQRSSHVGAAKLDWLMQQLEQLSSTHEASAGTGGAPNTSGAGMTGYVSSPGAVGASSNVANIEATLNQLLQNLRLSASSTNAAAGSVTAAQSSGLQHQLLDRVRQLAQQGSPHVFIGRMLSTVA